VCWNWDSESGSLVEAREHARTWEDSNRISSMSDR
jgi:hypothetical protein